MDLTSAPLSRRFGKELRAGDVIGVQFSRRDTIVSLTPYTGPLAHLFSEGASLATFALSKVGMTIEHIALFDVFNR